MSPEAPGEPTGAFIDAALALDEPVQRLGIRLVPSCVPHDAAPLTPRPLVSLGRVSGGPNAEAIQGGFVDQIRKTAAKSRKRLTSHQAVEAVAAVETLRAAISNMSDNRARPSVANDEK
jgi:hypothetical protein